MNSRLSASIVWILRTTEAVDVRGLRWLQREAVYYIYQFCVCRMLSYPCLKKKAVFFNIVFTADTVNANLYHVYSFCFWVFYRCLLYFFPPRLDGCYGCINAMWNFNNTYARLISVILLWTPEIKKKKKCT